MKLRGVMIGSDQPKVLGAFYTKVFGAPGWQQDEWYGFGIGDGSLMIGPHSDVHGKSQSPGRVMFNVEVEDVAAEFARIKDIGAEVIAEPYQPDKDSNPDAWLATFADPDGNYFQFATPWKR
jgi:predicted enzyme related to lactoylglutathione lyase